MQVKQKSSGERFKRKVLMRGGDGWRSGGLASSSQRPRSSELSAAIAQIQDTVATRKRGLTLG